MMSRQLRDQTHSYVDADEIIGREDEMRAILDIILGSPCSAANKATELSVVPIVGIGGLGKTTLVQLVYNDELVENHFELKLWVCIDQVFDVKEVVKKILMSAKNAETQNLEMDQLQGQLRQEIGGKKYLLVLDDVWNENPEKWDKLRDLLKIGQEGSKVLVTTRSMEVANIMGTVGSYELKGLSEEKSWELFEKMAFGPEDAQKKPHLVEIGKEIIKKCASVPLAIRTLGSLLRGKDERKWASVKCTSLAELPENQNNITAILKLSYHHLWSPLKNCFAYCALFPKDYTMKKETLIDLWMAQGFIIPQHENHSLDEIAEEYFINLLQRCFFQDIVKDEWGNIESCKMHDLMHDLALEVAGYESKIAKLEDQSFSAKVHHCSLAYRLTSSWEIPSFMLSMKHLRTFLLPMQVKDGSDFNKFVLRQLMSNFRLLRSLDLSKLGVTSLPESIEKLIHLRYLNLSSNPITELPDSITRLQNLQTLNLSYCKRIRVLPISIRKLTNLRSLDLGQGHHLTHMPSGIGELTSLYKLNLLKVQHLDSAKSSKLSTAQLRDLKNLNNITGALQIVILGDMIDPVSEAKEADLTSKPRLTKLHIQVARDRYEDVSGSHHDEATLEGLKPHPNLRKLEIYWYRGQKLPSWGISGQLCTNLPNLVDIQLLRCGRVQQLPTFSKLPFLKRLSLVSLQSVEYVESGPCVSQHSSASSLPSAETTFFPSLEELTLMSMDSLKGWWNETEANFCDVQQEISKQSDQQALLPVSFSKLAKLRIHGCPNLVSFPLCPRIEELELTKVNKKLLVLKKFTGSVMNNEIGALATNSGFTSKLKTLSTDNTEDLISLPKECLQQLSSLDIQDSKLVNTVKLGHVFKSLSSLSSLRFLHCSSLRTVSEDMGFLTALEKLVFWNCEVLDLSTNEELKDENGMPWKALEKLQSLELHMIPKLIHLPTGLQHLINLRSLKISCNDNVIAIPEWICCLTSLEFIHLYECPGLTSLPEGFRNLTKLDRLLIMQCPGLTERCRRPAGSEWPKIQHIPSITVLKSVWD